MFFVLTTANPSFLFLEETVFSVLPSCSILSLSLLSLRSTYRAPNNSGALQDYTVDSCHNSSNLASHEQ